MSISFNLQWLTVIPAIFTLWYLGRATIGIPLLFGREIAPMIGTIIILQSGGLAFVAGLITVLMFFATRK